MPGITSPDPGNYCLFLDIDAYTENLVGFKETLAAAVDFALKTCHNRSGPGDSRTVPKVILPVHRMWYVENVRR